MKAVILTGGKQYLVEEGTEIYVELLDQEPESTVVFDKVLMVNGVPGTPYVNAKVTGVVDKHGKNKKIIIFKYRPKKKSHSKQGHRQPYTKVTITKIESL